MGKICKIVLLVIVIVTLFLVNLSPAIAAEVSELTQESESALEMETSPEILWNEVSNSEVSTIEEFCDAFNDMNHTGGVIRVTEDLVVPADDEVYSLWPSKTEDIIFVELGEHSLYVEGNLRVQSGVSFHGDGGENGLIHIRNVGQAALIGAVLKADKGYSVIQEGGSIFCHVPTSDDTGEILYAPPPTAEPFSSTSWQVYMPVAVVNNEQTVEDVLPKTDLVTLYQNGIQDNGSLNEGTEIPVIWNLDPYREQLNAHERVEITGSYPNAAAYRSPVCLVVFQNDNPIVFLNCWGTENYGQPGVKVNVMRSDPTLHCRFEWSQDGKTWLPADAKESQTSFQDRLSYHVTFPQDVSPTYPYYLSAVVDYPDGSYGYSEVLVIREAKTMCGSGGNRGGGTDLTSPKLPAETESSTIECNSTENNSTEISSTENNSTEISSTEISSTEISSTEISSTEISSTEISSTEISSTEGTETEKNPIPKSLNKSQNTIDQTSSSSTPESPLFKDTNGSNHDFPVKQAANLNTETPEEKTYSEAFTEPEKQENNMLQINVIGQMSAGIMVTASIILLTITWNPKAGWGKKLHDFLSTLIRRTK